MAIRVLLVDDHKVVVEGLRSLLSSEQEIELVGTATTADEALRLVRECDPDVIVLDVTMAPVNGFDLLRQIREISQEAEVVALSMHATPQIATDMLRAGASSYVLKSASTQHLIAAIRAVMTGETYLPPEVASMVPQDLLRPHRDTDPAIGAELSAREKEVLALVAQGKSSKEIAAELYVTTKTIVWHRQSIMAKLGLRTVPELTKYAVRMGLTPLDT